MDVMIHSSNFLLPNPAAADNINGLTSPPRKYALIILNQRLPRITPLLWSHAQLRVCADGGANRLFDELPEFFPQDDAVAVRKKYKPDVIKGDMDSVRNEVVDFYSNLPEEVNGTGLVRHDLVLTLSLLAELSKGKLIHSGKRNCSDVQGTAIIDASYDQDTTDLYKCVIYIHGLSDPQKSNLCILVVGALGGRFDHEIGNINVLYRFSSMRIILLNDDCLIQLLPGTHRHEIHINPSIEGPHCGLAPFGMPSQSTTTTGLLWDLRNTEMKFGGLISTSNIAKGEIVTVCSDSDLIWTISIKKA